MTSWILILLTFLPFLAAIIAYMLGRRDERAMNGFVSITGIVIFALSVVPSTSFFHVYPNTVCAPVNESTSFSPDITFTDLTKIMQNATIAKRIVTPLKMLPNNFLDDFFLAITALRKYFLSDENSLAVNSFYHIGK